MYRQELDTEHLERGVQSASSSDEEVLPHCRVGYEGSSGSESDLPEIAAEGAVYGCDIDLQ